MTQPVYKKNGEPVSAGLDTLIKVMRLGVNEADRCITRERERCNHSGAEPDEVRLSRLHGERAAYLYCLLAAEVCFGLDDGTSE